MSKSRGNKTSKAVRAERQAKALDLMKAGLTQKDIAAELGISRMTFWRDLQSIEARYIEGSSEDVKQFKEAQYKALLQIESAAAEGTIPPDVATVLVRVRSEVAKLLGLNAPTKSIVGHVSGPQLDALYLDVREVLIDLDKSAQEEGLQLLREWAATRKKPVITTVPGLLEAGDANFS
jgi:hypothetical protein